MNWTGGQLRRYSARQGILSKTQRQNFAKSRQQASSRVPRQLSTCRGIPGPDVRDDDRLDDTTCMGGQLTGNKAQNYIRSPRDPPLDQSIPVDSTGRLETLKRRLLRDPDWAAVSAARPLEITFASPQEAEHFGKRRRLTERDQKRLSADHENRPTLAFPKPHYWTELRGTDTALDQIEIKLTGQPGSQRSKDSKGSHTYPHGSGNHDFPQSPSLPRPRLSTNGQYVPPSRSDLRVAQAPNSAGSPIPRRRHFDIIEEQELGEKTTRTPRRSNSIPSREPSCSPTETLPASPALIPTDSLSNWTQSWLPLPTRRPLPTHRPFPSSPLLCRAEAAKSPAVSSHVPYSSHNSSDPFIRRTEEICPAAPVKIFGQLVRMYSGDDSAGLL